MIDAHQHFWDLERNRHPWLSDPISIPFRYGDYGAAAPQLPACRFSHRHGTSHDRCYGAYRGRVRPRRPGGRNGLAQRPRRRRGIATVCVAQAWLDREDVAETLAAQAARPMVRGIRHKPRAAASVTRGAPGSMDCPVWRAGYALLERHGLSFDLQTPWWHMDAAADLARDFPANADHDQPHRTAGGPFAGSARRLACGARRGGRGHNVALKISGLGQPGAAWSHAANGPVIRDAIAIFGVERCMFASNFPVDGLVADYDTIVDTFLRGDRRSPGARTRLLLHDNARRIYRM